MLSCWERKENSRPTFSSFVSTLVSYMEILSDYLAFKAASADEKNPSPESIQVPDDKHGLFRVVSNPNDYDNAELPPPPTHLIEVHHSETELN